ncbi:MAG: thiamine phosphate synthase [bacterium]
MAGQLNSSDPESHDRRMRVFCDAALYLVTSQEVSGGRSTLDIIRCALAGGVRLVQLREKGMCDRDLFGLALQARRLTSDAGAILLINDRVDIALACGADGVHLGRGDVPVDAARRIAPDLVIGASAHSVADVIDAQQKGASYVNIGPVFPTTTKKVHDSAFLGLEGLGRIRAAASIPFTVMGGIKREHIAALVEEGARTVAVVSAVTMADDPERAARELLDEIRRALASRRLA